LLNSIEPSLQPIKPTGTEYAVKSWTHFFQAIKRGDKLHDMRDLKDRNYRIGDILNLQEYDPFTGKYSGDECKVMITYITSADTPCAFSSAALAPGFAILSLRLQP
jgi:hypothetical protein